MIKKIENIDYSRTSILEIEEIIALLMTGYVLNAPQINPGNYLYRAILYREKPTLINQLGYPPANLVTKCGRANSVNQSMFYCSTDKSAPFFELRPKVGDTLAISTWRTKDVLLLNHIGFTKEVTDMLKSKRDLTSIHDFVETTKKSSTLNEYVYNFLGSSFAQKIDIENSHLYNLTNAIANKLLTGDVFNGILYPSILMFGNADNIVLKPEVFDKVLEFVSVEFVNITVATDSEYKFTGIDSAVQIENNTIKWTGKLLSWKVLQDEPIIAKRNGDSWTVTNDNGDIILPTPVAEVNINSYDTNTHSQFINSFTETAKINWEISWTLGKEQGICKCTMNLDIINNAKFLSVYIPMCSEPIKLYQNIIEKYEELIHQNDKLTIQVEDIKTGQTLKSHSDLIDSNEIHFFTEDKNSIDQFIPAREDIMICFY